MCIFLLVNSKIEGQKVGLLQELHVYVYFQIYQ